MWKMSVPTFDTTCTWAAQYFSLLKEFLRVWFWVFLAYGTVFKHFVNIIIDFRPKYILPGSHLCFHNSQVACMYVLELTQCSLGISIHSPLGISPLFIHLCLWKWFAGKSSWSYLWWVAAISGWRSAPNPYRLASTMRYVGALVS